MVGTAVRVGVLGLRRGAALARLARDAGMRVVALCERDDRRREEAAGALGAAAYRDLEPFLDHRDMDAVLLVNDFDQHAPVAIRALERGLSALSETAACSTLAEGVALVEAAERPATSARSVTPRPSTWTSRPTWPRWGSSCLSRGSMRPTTGSLSCRSCDQTACWPPRS